MDLNFNIEATNIKLKNYVIYDLILQIVRKNNSTKDDIDSIEHFCVKLIDQLLER